MIGILDLYEKFLAFAGLKPDSEGVIYEVALSPKGKTPITIDGKLLVLPTKAMLRSGRQDVIFFHPLYEIPGKRQSPVVEKFREVVNVRLNFTASRLMLRLLEIASSADRQVGIDPNARSILIKLGHVDHQTKGAFVDIFTNAFKAKPDAFIVNIYLRKGGNVDDVKYPRVGIVTFPLYQELKEIAKAKDKDKKIHGVKVRDKDIATFIKLHEAIFESIEDKDPYNVGSHSDVGPYTDALLKTALKLSNELADKLEVLKDSITDYESLLFDDDWVVHFQDPPSWRTEVHSIPPQDGGVGPVLTQPQEAPLAAATAVAPIQPGPYQPPQPNRPLSPPAPSAIDVADQWLFGHNRPIQPMGPGPYPGQFQPSGYSGYGGYQQPPYGYREPPACFRGPVGGMPAPGTMPGPGPGYYQAPGPGVGYSPFTQQISPI